MRSSMPERYARLVWSFAAICAWSICHVDVRAESTASREAAEAGTDTCRVSIDAPAGARVLVDGEDRGAVRLLTFSQLPLDRCQTADIRIQGEDGVDVRKRLLLRGGTEIALKVAGPRAQSLEAVPQLGHSDTIESCVFSPNAEHLVTLAYDLTAILWKTETGEALRRFPAWNGAAFCADGRTLITIDWSEIATWDIRSGRQIERLGISQGYTYRAIRSVSPTGRFLATAGEGDGQFDVWKIHDAGDQRFRLGSAPEFTVKSSRDLTWTDDDRCLWSTDTNVLIRHDAVTGKEVQRFAVDGEIAGFSCSPAARRVLTTSKAGALALWDADSGGRLPSFPELESSSGRVARLLPDGERAIVATDSNVVLLDLATGERTSSFAASGTPELFLSDNGARLVTQQRDAVSVWNVSAASRVCDLPMIAAECFSIAVTSTGELLIGCEDAATRLWNPLTADVRLFDASVYSSTTPISLTRDDQVALQRSQSDAAILLNLANGYTKRTIELGESIDSMALSPRGDFVAFSDGQYSSTRGRISIWSTTDATQPVWTTEYRDWRVAALAFSPDGSQLAVNWNNADRYSGNFEGNQGLIILYETSTGRILTLVQSREEGRSLNFAADGSAVWLATYGGLSCWELNSAVLRRKCESRMKSLAMTADGSLMLTGGGTSGEYGGLSLIDLAKGRARYQKQAHTDIIVSGAISPDGSTFVTGSRDGTAALWNTSTGEQTGALTRQNGNMRRIQFSPDGRSLAIGTFDGTVTLWSMETFQPIRRLTGLSKIVTSLEFSRDGRYVAAGGDGIGCVVWNVESGTAQLVIQPTDQSVTALALSPDASRLLTCLNSGEMAIWDVSTGQKTLSQPTEELHQCAVFATDGESWFTCPYDSLRMLTVQWDARTGERKQEFVLPGGLKYVEWMTARRDGEIIIGCLDGTAVRWRTADGGMELMNQLSDGSVFALSPDGTMIVTDHGTLWDSRSGFVLRMFAWPADAAKGLSFSHDGRHVLTAGTDGAIHAWSVATGDEVLRVYFEEGGDQWLAATPEGRFDGPPAMRSRVRIRIGDELDVVRVNELPDDLYVPGLVPTVLR